MWVAVFLLGSSQICWYAAIICLPGGELLCLSWAPLEFAMKFLPEGELLYISWASLEFADMLLLNLIQEVSGCVAPGLQLNLLTCCYNISPRMWVAVCLLGSTWIADILLWNPCQNVSCHVSPVLPSNLLTCHYQMPSRRWVAVWLLGSCQIC